MVTDNPDSINEVVSAVTGDELDSNFTDQSNNYHIRNWKVLESHSFDGAG